MEITNDNPPQRSNNKVDDQLKYPRKKTTHSFKLVITEVVR